jgi:hypothetical protein
MHEPTPPTTDENGYEHHPAWGLIGAHRSSGGSAVLFDSDIKHRNTVTVRLYDAKRQRNLNRDWIGTDGRAPFVEVEMSEAQWASFVSSMNTSDGVPCTIRKREDDWDVPGVEYAPRLQESMEETRTAADEAFKAVFEAFEAYEEKKNAANLRNLKYAILNAPSNIEFAGKSLVEHAENVVQKARADIEAMVVSKAVQIGLDPGELDARMLEAPDNNEKEN